MIVRPVLVALAVAAPLASLRGTVQDQEAEAQDAVATEQVAEDDLHETMERLQTEMKGLRKLLKPETKDEAIAACEKMSGIVLETMAMSPEPLEPLEGVELMEYDVEFKKRMAGVYTTALDLKMAIAKDDRDATKALYRELGAQKKDGHTIYIDGK